MSWRCVNRAFSGLVGTEADIGGGFAAWGGPLTVDLGGRGETLTFGTPAFWPAPLRLQDDVSVDDLDWMNPVDLDEKTMTLSVARTSTVARVRWHGALTGGGTLKKIGEGVFALADGADVAADVTLDVNKNFSVDVTNALAIAGSVVDGGGFHKLGAGVLTADGAWTVAGSLYVDAGSALFNGTVTGNGNVTVAAAGTLGGSGALTMASGKSVTVNGALLATTNGPLAVTGNVAFGADAKVKVEDDSVFANKKTTITALTYTGTVTGAPTGEDLPSGWNVRTGNGSVRIRYTSGTMIVVR